MALLQLPAKSADGQRPTRLPVLPAGARIEGDDGRAWTVSDRQAVLKRLNALKNPLIADENHSLIRAAKNGQPSPALARLSKFEMDADGSIWASQVEYTKYGENAFDGGHYIGLSPVLLHRPNPASIKSDSLGDVTSLHSISFVNDPNLELPALNDKEIPQEDPEDMKPEELVAALNTALAPINAAVTALTTKVAELETKTAENAKDPKAEQFALSVNSKMEGLITAGKLENSPEARAYFCSRAKDEASLAAVAAEYAARTAMVSTNSIELQPDLKTGAPKLAPKAVAAFASLGWDVAALHEDKQLGLFRG